MATKGTPWFESFGQEVEKNQLTLYAYPFRGSAEEMAQATLHTFGPYDAGGGEWKFSTGLRLEVPEASGLRWLFAVATGGMTYRPGADGAPGSVVLARGDVSGTALVQAAGILPAWFPQAKYVVYENVDPAQARAAVLAALKRDRSRLMVLELLRRRTGKPVEATDEQLADLWLRGETPGVLVYGGDLLGACGAGPAAGKRFTQIWMADEAGPTPARFYNPAYYLSAWDAMGWLTINEPVGPPLTDVGAPPLASGKMRFVRQGSTTEAAPYDTPARASTTVAAAIAAAQPGETVVILDQETYIEQLTLEKPISVMGTGKLPATSAEPDYPTISGDLTHRPFFIQNITSGAAHLGRLRIHRGKSSGHGGGVFVNRSDRVVISNCLISECRTFEGNGGGGAIALVYSSAAVLGCVLAGNTAGTTRGGGILVFGYGWPTIANSVIRSNGASGADSNALPDGGGIAITISWIKPEKEVPSSLLTVSKSNLATFFDAKNLQRSRGSYVRIVRCRIEDNSALDDGGGIYVSVMSGVILRDTEVLNNRCKLDGGGIRATMESELILIGCTIQGNTSNIINNDMDSGGPGGGGISSRNCRRVRLERTRVEGNTAIGWAGGGIYLTSSDEGKFPTPTIKGDIDWNDILRDVFRHAGTRLEIDAFSQISGNKATRLTGQASDHGKGGGIYLLRWKGNRASGVDPVVLSGLPLTVSIAQIGAVTPDNDGSFPGADRFFLQDLVAPGPKDPIDDADLPASGAFQYP